jgi:AmmeMemoRadiSam system protein A
MRTHPIPTPSPGPAERGALLLRLARAAIGSRLGLATPEALPEPQWLGAPGATFVTLRAGGDLRGCIGSVAAVRPLGVDVRENAVAAAFRDPRFPPLGRHELGGLSVEVSVLSEAEPIPAVTDEASAIASLRPGVDGVILEAGGFLRSTFLPQVWDELPDAAGFLANLRRKAGLPARAWEPSWRLLRYTVEKHAEGDRP